MGGVEMPWLPDFTNAVELARLQTRAAGQADPVAQYVAALNSGDTHALEAVWPAEGGRLRPPLWRGPWPQAASGVRQPQPATTETVDLDGYDYRWLRVRPSAQGA